MKTIIIMCLRKTIAFHSQNEIDLHHIRHMPVFRAATRATANENDHEKIKKYCNNNHNKIQIGRSNVWMNVIMKCAYKLETCNFVDCIRHWLQHAAMHFDHAAQLSKCTVGCVFKNSVWFFNSHRMRIIMFACICHAMMHFRCKIFRPVLVRFMPGHLRAFANTEEEESPLYVCCEKKTLHLQLMSLPNRIKHVENKEHFLFSVLI